MSLCQFVTRFNDTGSVYYSSRSTFIFTNFFKGLLRTWIGHRFQNIRVMKKKLSYEPLNHLSHKILNTESDTQHSPPTAVFISFFLFNKVNMFIKWRHKTTGWDYKLVWETFNNIRKLLRKRVLFASAKVFCSTFVFTFKVTRWLPTFHLLVMQQIGNG